MTTREENPAERSKDRPDLTSPDWERVFRVARIPLWIQDLTAVRQAVLGVIADGVDDLEAWLNAHPEFISRMLGMIRVVDVNDAAIELNGAAGKEDLLRSLDRLVVTESLAGYKALVLALAGGRRYVEGECQFCTLDGRPYNTMIHAWLPEPDDDPPYMVLATIDITDLKRTQQALAGSQEQYRLLVETARDLIIRHDLAGRITFMNQAGLDLVGGTLDEMLGSQAMDLVPTHLRAEVADRARRRAAGHAGVFLYETAYLTRDGRSVPVEVSSALIPGPVYGAGEPQVLLIARDISERKRVQREQMELEARLRNAQKLESIGVLAGGIAHDFNNLLVTIMGNTEMALEDLPVGAVSREGLQAALEAAGQAAELCRQVQTYAGQGQVDAKQGDLNAVVRGIRRLIRVTAPGGSHLDVELAEDLPGAMIDHTGIRQVILNLVTNAAESLHREGGRITVRTGCRSYSAEDLAAGEFAGALTPGKYVYCEVEDTGCGMEPHVAARLFDPFFSTKFVGRGLGLSAALGIIKGHDGGFTVRTAPGTGTTIGFLLPPLADRKTAGMTVRSATNPEVDVAPDLRILTGKTILVVDDEPEVRKVAESCLRRLGCQVLSAGDGFEAVRVFGGRHQEIEIVLMDLTMAGMDGLTACRRLRAIRPDIPLVLASGFHERTVYTRLEDLDHAGYVAKPFTLSELGNVMARAATKAAG